jgi:hypothetical protein
LILSAYKQQNNLRRIVLTKAISKKRLYFMKKRYWVLIGVVVSALALSGCVYDIHGRTFISSKDALRYQQQKIGNQISRIEQNTYHGGSLLIYYHYNSLDSTLSNVSAPVYNDFLSRKEKVYLDGIKLAFEKSKMFDSVTIKKVHDSTDWQQAKGSDFRYLLNMENRKKITVCDLKSYKIITIIVSKYLDTMVVEVNNAISSLNGKKLADKKVPTPEDQLPRSGNSREKLTFDKKTKLGSISIPGNGIDARTYLIERIGNICFSLQEKAKKVDGGNSSGYFNIIDEKVKNGRMTIKFEIK